MSKALQELSEALPETKHKKETTAPTYTSTNDKFKALKDIEKSINKQFDTTMAVVRVGDKVDISIPSLPTDLPSLDFSVIGIGGFPAGRITELYGSESAGKTTLALHLLGREQKRGNLVAFIDVEHSLSLEFAQKLGVDIENLILSQPQSAEEALTIIEELVESKIVSLIVLDSVASLCPQVELEGDIGNSNMGVIARMMGQTLRKIRGICNINGVSVIFINQTRMKIGVVYGNPETTPGGMALKFFSSLRLDVRRKEVIKDGNDQIGHVIRIRAVKNKVSSPFKETEISLFYDTGLDILGDTVTYAVSKGAIERSGAWYSIAGGERLGQGIENVKQALLDDPALLKSVQEKIKIGLDKPQTM